jgi:hypothetical protein
MNKILIIICAAILVGCASSGPIPMGKDTYLITKQSAGGMFVSASSVKVQILKEAYAFCSSQNKVFQIVRTNELGAIPGRLPSAEVQFMCLNEGDSEINRPKMRGDSNIIIETRAR